MISMLVVEKDAKLRESLACLPEWRHVGVTLMGAVGTGEEALLLMNNGNVPDIVITDIKLPKMSGLEMLEDIKNYWPHVRFIIYTAGGAFCDMQQAIRLQVTDYIKKPSINELPGAVKGIVEELIQMKEQKEAFFHKQLCRHLPHLYEQVGSVKNSHDHKHLKIVEETISYIKANIDQPTLQLGDVARGVQVSRSHINFIFKEATQMTVNQFIVKLKMEKAACLLQNPHVKVYEVCHRIGYSDQNFFRNTFKKAYGTTPSVFQKYCLNSLKAHSIEGG